MLDEDANELWIQMTWKTTVAFVVEFLIHFIKWEKKFHRPMMKFVKIITFAKNVWQLWTAVIMTIDFRTLSIWSMERMSVKVQRIPIASKINASATWILLTGWLLMRKLQEFFFIRFKIFLNHNWYFWTFCIGDPTNVDCHSGGGGAGNGNGGSNTQAIKNWQCCGHNYYWLLYDDNGVFECEIENGEPQISNTITGKVTKRYV